MAQIASAKEDKASGGNSTRKRDLKMEEKHENQVALAVGARHGQYRYRAHNMEFK